MKKKNRKAFILYQYNQFNNDYEYLKEYYSVKDLKEDKIFNIKNTTNIYQYITNNIDNIKSLINNKYIIITETIEEL